VSDPVNVNLDNEQLQQLEDTLSIKQNDQMVHVQGNMVYFGQSVSSPAVGDVRVMLTKIIPTDISIIAKVTGDSFERYVAKNGREVSMTSMGIVSADVMISKAKSANKTLTWVLRLLSAALVIGGLKSMFSILPSLFKVVPVLGKIIGAGVGLICIVGGGAWSLVIISISWLFYRPLIAIPMLAAAVGGIIFLGIKGKKQKADT
jgi:hypothetical protein